MNNTVKDSAIKKLKLLITVVDRPKGEFYLDVLGQYNVNFQMVTNGQGTANSQLLELLGLEPHKAVIFSVVREDLVEEIMNCLEDKFHSVRGGKGICFAEDVMDVARENGARGGTILNARGVVKEDTAHFFGITVHADKEILMMVVEKTIRDRVLNVIYKEMGMAKKAKGIAFSMPVSDVAGLALPTQQEPVEG